MLLFVFLRGAFLFTATPRTRKEFLSRQSLLWLRGRTIGALRAERHTLTSAEWTSCPACHELLCSLLARLPLYCSAECATPKNSSLFAFFSRNLANAPLPCLRNARAFPLQPAALASVPFGFVLVRVRVQRFIIQSFKWAISYRQSSTYTSKNPATRTNHLQQRYNFNRLAGPLPASS
jgi:hypothetical protein